MFNHNFEWAYYSEKKIEFGVMLANIFLAANPDPLYFHFDVF